MAKEAKRVAPYIPFKTFQTSLQVLSQGLPSRLDTSIWPSFSGAVRTQVLSAYKFLELVDDEGHVQSDLERLLGEDSKAVLREILEHSYPEVVNLGRTNASPAQFSDAMRNYGVSGETLEKAERFFLQAAHYTGLQVSPLWKKARAAAPDKRKARATRRQKQPTKDRGPTPKGDVPQKAEDLMNVALQSGGMVVLGVNVDVTKMSSEDRSFVFDLIDRMREYADGQSKRPALGPPSHPLEQERGGE